MEPHYYYSGFIIIILLDYYYSGQSQIITISGLLLFWTKPVASRIIAASYLAVSLRFGKSFSGGLYLAQNWHEEGPR
jgi:hypothetical protein